MGGDAAVKEAQEADVRGPPRGPALSPTRVLKAHLCAKPPATAPAGVGSRVARGHPVRALRRVPLASGAPAVALAPADRAAGAQRAAAWLAGPRLGGPERLKPSVPIAPTLRPADARPA